jgi:hypothetical protein
VEDGLYATVKVRLEPLEDATLVTLLRSRNTYDSGPRGTLVVGVILAALKSAFVLFGDFEPYVWLLPGVLWTLPPLGLLGRQVTGRRF